MIQAAQQATGTGKPKLGFLGVGWIGRSRLEAVAKSGFATIDAIADVDPDLVGSAQQLAPGCEAAASLDELLERDLDGIVIATPSAMHAEQTIAARERGMSVFCQKPLGRDAYEISRIIDAAKAADRLVSVDLSYRYVDGVDEIRRIVQSGGLGRIFSADLVFHNAYGPDKSWFFDRTLSGGGCLIDLGVHLLDLAFYVLGEDCIPLDASARIYAKGQRLRTFDQVEDFATASLDLSNGAVVNLACSWNLSAGCDANISAAFYGTAGGVSFRNVDGSFFDFTAERLNGTSAETLARCKGWEWGGRAILNWVEQLGRGNGYDASLEHLIPVAESIDAIYANAGK